MQIRKLAFCDGTVYIRVSDITEWHFYKMLAVGTIIAINRKGLTVNANGAERAPMRGAYTTMLVSGNSLENIFREKAWIAAIERSIRIPLKDTEFRGEAIYNINSVAVVARAVKCPNCGGLIDGYRTVNFNGDGKAYSLGKFQPMSDKGLKKIKKQWFHEECAPKTIFESSVVSDTYVKNLFYEYERGMVNETLMLSTLIHLCRQKGILPCH